MIGRYVGVRQAGETAVIRAAADDRAERLRRMQSRMAVEDVVDDAAEFVPETATECQLFVERCWLMWCKWGRDNFANIYTDVSGGGITLQTFALM